MMFSRSLPRENTQEVRNKMRLEVHVKRWSGDVISTVQNNGPDSSICIETTLCFHAALLQASNQTANGLHTAFMIKYSATEPQI